MITKKRFSSVDGVTSRFLSDFIIQSEQFVRVYNYFYNPAGIEGEIDPGTGLPTRVLDFPNPSEDLIGIDKWDLVDNSILFYIEPVAGSSVYIEVATTPEEFGDTLTAPAVEKAENAAAAAEASAAAALVSENASEASAAAALVSENAAAVSEANALLIGVTAVNSVDVSIVSELSLVDITKYTSVNVRGYYVPNDGGGGIFNYDVTQAAINDSVNIFNGWVRQKSDISTFEHGGAKGDGIEDDLVAINNVLAVATDIQPSNKTYFVSSLPDFSAGHVIHPNKAIIKVAAGQHTASNINLKNAGGLTIDGTAITSTTLTDITAITGSTGAWSLTGTVADATGISIGDVIRIKDVLPGIKAPGLIAERPVRGQMHMAFFLLGEISVTGTTATISGTGVLTYLATSDLIIVKGQVRRIISITDDTTFVISSALAADVTALQYWYYFDNVPLGLCTATGTTTVTCSSAFAPFLTVGSLIGITDAGLRRIVSIDSDTTITVDNPITATSAVWGVVDSGENHEGAWIVTNVSGTSITWTNTIQTSQGVPPIANFTSANIDVIKTKLEFIGNGATVEDGTLILSNISLVGNGTGYGVDVRPNNSSSKAVLNSNVSILNFSYGIRANNTGSIYGGELQITNCASRGADITEGGFAWLQKATINGNTGIGLFVGPGSYSRLTDVRIQGNSAQGLRMEVGASAWCDFGYIGSNGADGALVVGGVDGHFVGTRVTKNTGDGIEGQNGLYGRATGAFIVGNGGAGVRLATGQLEANQTNLISNGAYGAVITGGHMKLNEAGTSGNASSGVLVLETGRVSINTLQSTDESLALNCQDEGLIRGDSVGLANNGVDATVLSGGKINIENSGAFTASVTKNTFTTSFGYIADGTSVPL